MNQMTSSLPFEEAVKLWLPELRHYCVYLTGSVWDGEDLLQETVALTFRYYKRQGEIKEIRAFLMKVARNKRIDQFRKRRLREDSGLCPKEEGRRDTCYFEIRGWLEWVAARLPASQLNVWLLADYFGFTMIEIAGGLRMTMSAVRSQLFRAREKLRSCRLSYDLEQKSEQVRGARSTSKSGRRSAQSVPFGQLAAIDLWTGCIMCDDPKPLFMAARTGT
ncbi:RNA polymerase sigma factor [Paenibacillus sp. LHD-117]|uniref:RNA polymerase sigma factor n=1 Tax=Paenibacillus sp. LHD-117 TaxID=3071412 RepID=UPI0027E16166|nr:RNA polymerase sigma factor [Paenibacillus sp. LHD-117]MDQ6422383.1 RNA polymerase sigma factor [Paenibacillus sp. LHD-117]